MNNKQKEVVERAKRFIQLDCTKCDCDWSGSACDYYGRGWEDIKILLEIIEELHSKDDTGSHDLYCPCRSCEPY